MCLKKMHTILKTFEKNAYNFKNVRVVYEMFIVVKKIYNVYPEKYYRVFEKVSKACILIKNCT